MSLQCHGELLYVTNLCGKYHLGSQKYGGRLPNPLTLDLLARVQPCLPRRRYQVAFSSSGTLRIGQLRGSGKLEVTVHHCLSFVSAFSQLPALTSEWLYSVRKLSDQTSRVICEYSLSGKEI